MKLLKILSGIADIKTTFSAADVTFSLIISIVCCVLLGECSYLNNFGIFEILGTETFAL